MLDDTTLLCPEAARLLAGMAADARPGYAQPAKAALAALRDGTLAGIQSSSTRFWITLHHHRARPVRARSGALFQCLPRGGHPRSERELVGWIVLQDGYSSGPLVLVHELSHFLNRWVVWGLLGEEARVIEPGLAAGLSEQVVRTVRARLLDEVAARHLAWLAETGSVPGRTALPEPGALMACAVKIASYPEVYADQELMPRLLARHDEAMLRDQIGAWMAPLASFRFFDPGSELAAVHRAYLEHEVAIASAGRGAPRVRAEGTL